MTIKGLYLGLISILYLTNISSTKVELTSHRPMEKHLHVKRYTNYPNLKTKKNYEESQGIIHNIINKTRNIVKKNSTISMIFGSFSLSKLWNKIFHQEVQQPNEHPSKTHISTIDSTTTQPSKSYESVSSINNSNWNQNVEATPSFLQSNGKNSTTNHDSSQLSTSITKENTYEETNPTTLSYPLNNYIGMNSVPHPDQLKPSDIIPQQIFNFKDQNHKQYITIGKDIIGISQNSTGIFQNSYDSSLLEILKEIKDPNPKLRYFMDQFPDNRLDLFLNFQDNSWLTILVPWNNGWFYDIYNNEDLSFSKKQELINNKINFFNFLKDFNINRLNYFLVNNHIWSCKLQKFHFKFLLDIYSSSLTSKEKIIKIKYLLETLELLNCNEKFIEFINNPFIIEYENSKLNNKSLNNSETLGNDDGSDSSKDKKNIEETYPYHIYQTYINNNQSALKINSEIFEINIFLKQLNVDNPIAWNELINWLNNKDNHPVFLQILTTKSYRDFFHKNINNLWIKPLIDNGLSYENFYDFICFIMSKSDPVHSYKDMKKHFYSYKVYCQIHNPNFIEKLKDDNDFFYKEVWLKITDNIKNNDIIIENFIKNKQKSIDDKSNNTFKTQTKLTLYKKTLTLDMIEEDSQEYSEYDKKFEYPKEPKNLNLTHNHSPNIQSITDNKSQITEKISDKFIEESFHKKLDNTHHHLVDEYIPLNLSEDNKTNISYTILRKNSININQDDDTQQHIPSEDDSNTVYDVSHNHNDNLHQSLEILNHQTIDDSSNNFFNKYFDKEMINDVFHEESLDPITNMVSEIKKNFNDINRVFSKNKLKEINYKDLLLYLNKIYDQAEKIDEESLKKIFLLNNLLFWNAPSNKELMENFFTHGQTIHVDDESRYQINQEVKSFIHLIKKLNTNFINLLVLCKPSINGLDGVNQQLIIDFLTPLIIYNKDYTPYINHWNEHFIWDMNTIQCLNNLNKLNELWLQLWQIIILNQKNQDKDNLLKNYNESTLKFYLSYEKNYENLFNITIKNLLKIPLLDNEHNLFIQSINNICKLDIDINAMDKSIDLFIDHFKNTLDQFKQFNQDEVGSERTDKSLIMKKKSVNLQKSVYLFHNKTANYQSQSVLIPHTTTNQNQPIFNFSENSIRGKSAEPKPSPDTNDNTHSHLFMDGLNFVMNSFKNMLSDSKRNSAIIHRPLETRPSQNLTMTTKLKMSQLGTNFKQTKDKVAQSITNEIQLQSRKRQYHKKTGFPSMITVQLNNQNDSQNRSISPQQFHEEKSPLKQEIIEPLISTNGLNYEKNHEDPMDYDSADSHVNCGKQEMTKRSLHCDSPNGISGILANTQNKLEMPIEDPLNSIYESILHNEASSEHSSDKSKEPSKEFSSESDENNVD